MEKSTIRERRSGTVLIIVIGILAVLILLAATLALTARVELKATKNYRYGQALDHLQDAVELYCAEILERDKFGDDGVPYNYEKLGSATGTYPGRTTTDGLHEDDENFDSYWTEEWLPAPNGATKDWRLFNTDTNDAAVWDTDGDGAIDDDTDDLEATWQPAAWVLGADAAQLMGGEVSGEFALYFFDAGGSALDVNAAGNVASSGGGHSQSQGLSPFEVSLADIVGATSAESIIAGSQGRYGANGFPGADGDDSNLLGTSGLDINLDGAVDTATPINEPNEFMALWPVGDDAPFAPADLYELMWLSDLSQGQSRIARILGGGRYPLTTRSSIQIVAGRSIRDLNPGTAPNVFATTNPTVGALGSYDVMNLGTDNWHKNRKGIQLVVRRAVQDALSTGDVDALRDFLLDLEPVVPAGMNRNVIVTQVAKNLLDMLDADSDPEPWTDDDASDPNFTDRTYYGVEMAPYVAEVEAAIDSGQNNVVSFAPYDNGDLPVPGDRVRDGNTLFWKGDSSTGQGPPTWASGTPPPHAAWEKWDRSDPIWIDNDNDKKYDENTDTMVWPDPRDKGHETTNIDDGSDFTPAETNNNPPTGWGKYIKIVNPWNKPMYLDDYIVEIPAEYPAGSGVYRLRRWVFRRASVGAWDSEAVTSIKDTIDDPSTHNLNHYPLSNPAPYERITDRIVIDLSRDDGDGKAEVIPPKGHYLIVDDPRTSGGAFASLLNNMDAAHWTSDPRINYMQEANGGIGNDTRQDHEPVDAFEGNNNGPTVVELRLANNRNLVMRFQAQESPNGEDDRDNWPSSSNNSTQINDPRPCWVRDLGGGLAMQSDPWAMNASNNVGERTRGDWATDTRSLGWFNRNWRGSGTVETGDGLAKLTGTNTPPANADNLLSSFPPVQPGGDQYTGAAGNDTRVMDNGILPSPGAVGFVHAGIPWGSVALTNPANPDDIGAKQIVYLRNFTDYLIGPVSPLENGRDDDGDGFVDEYALVDEGDESNSTDGINNDGDFQQPDGTQVSATSDKLGAEIRLHGRINVNTASKAVLKAALKTSWLQTMWSDPAGRADDIADAIIAERSTPFSSVDDFFERVPAVFAVDPNGDGSSKDHPNSARREALARFMYNLVTVRTDIWGVVARVRLYADEDNDGVCDPDEEIATKTSHLVLDRSGDEVETIVRRAAGR